MAQINSDRLVRLLLGRNGLGWVRVHCPMVGFGFLLKYTTVTFGQVEGSLVYHRTLSAAQLSFGFQWAVDWPMGLVAPLCLLEKKGKK